ncbi:hypothetical protein [Vibrio sp. L85]
MNQKGTDKTSVKLHTYLEIGACDENMVNLINMGLSREAANEIEDLLGSTSKIETIYQLLEMLDSKPLDNLHPVTKREIRTLAG